MTPRERLMVALDTPSEEKARRLARILAGRVGGFKVGLELFTSCGPGLVRELREAGHAVFLDLKLHDIPNTVAGAAAATARLGAAFLTVHALGGDGMIRRAVDAARDAAASAKMEPPVILAVTVLTSHRDEDLERLGLTGPCSRAVVRLAALAREAGAGGVVCSPLEVAAVRREFAAGTLVVPGIRPAGTGARPGDDQARVATPAEAVRAGADYLVIGRPVTRATDPAAAADAVAAELAAAVPGA